MRDLERGETDFRLGSTSKTQQQQQQAQFAMDDARKTAGSARSATISTLGVIQGRLADLGELAMQHLRMGNAR